MADSRQDLRAVLEAEDGRSVLVVERRQREAQVAFESMLAIAEPRGQVACASRVNGRERIDFRSGGRVAFASMAGRGGRGFSADVLVLDPSVLGRPDRLADLLACLATSSESQVWLSAGPIEMPIVAGISAP